VTVDANMRRTGRLIAMVDEMHETEKRIDPDDGQAYTFQEFSEFYKGKFPKKAVNAYWHQCRPALSKSSKGKAKLKYNAGNEKPPARESARVRNAVAWMEGGATKSFVERMSVGASGSYKVIGVHSAPHINPKPGNASKVEYDTELYIEFDGGLVLRVKPDAKGLSADGKVRFCEHAEALQAVEQISQDEIHRIEEAAISADTCGIDAAELLLAATDESLAQALWKAVSMNHVPAAETLLAKAPDDATRTKMLKQAQSCGVTVLHQAAGKGNEAMVNILLETAKAISKKVLVDILCAETCSCKGHHDVPNAGDHPLKAAGKNEGVRRMLLDAAEEAEGFDFRYELMSGRPKCVQERLDNQKEAARKRADEREAKLNAYKAITQDTPAEQAASIVLDYADGNMRQAVNSALIIAPEEGAGALRVLLAKAGADEFRRVTSNGMTLLQHAASLPATTEALVRAVLDAATSVGGSDLVEGMLLAEMPQDKVKASLRNPNSAPAPVDTNGESHYHAACIARTPEVRRALLETADACGGSELRRKLESARPLFLEAVGK